MMRDLDPRTRAALAALDPADAPDDAAGTPAATAALDRILATDPGPAAPMARRRRSGRWWAAVALPAAGALAVGTLVLGTPGADDAALATWQRIPAIASPADAALIERQCRKELADSMDEEAWTTFRAEEGFDPAQIRLALVERRGDWLFALLTGPHGLGATCATALPEGSTRIRGRVLQGVTAGEPARPGPRGFVPGGIHQRDKPLASFTHGWVGPDVAAMTIHADGRQVVATIRNGEYAAWWPGRAFPEGDPGPSGRGGPEPTLRYELTLRDGTLVRDAQPATFPPGGVR